MEELYGFPIVNSQNIFNILDELGIRPWEKTEDVKSFEKYVSEGLTEEQTKLLRFAPKTEVVSLNQPNGNPFWGFRSVGKDWVTTFSLIANKYVPVIGEYKHGADEVTLVMPSGVCNKSDLETGNPFLSCARREWEEETGLELGNIEPLTENPLIISGRQSTLRYQPFLGYVKMPIVKKPAKLDSTEDLKLVLVRIDEWLKIISNGRGVEDCAVSCTFLALRKMGMY